MWKTCTRIFMVLHKLYCLNPLRLKDWISFLFLFKWIGRLDAKSVREREMLNDWNQQWLWHSLAHESTQTQIKQKNSFWKRLSDQEVINRLAPVSVALSKINLTISLTLSCCAPSLFFCLCSMRFCYYFGLKKIPTERIHAPKHIDCTIVGNERKHTQNKQMKVRWTPCEACVRWWNGDESEKNAKKFLLFKSTVPMSICFHIIGIRLRR